MSTRIKRKYGFALAFLAISLAISAQPIRLRAPEQPVTHVLSFTIPEDSYQKLQQSKGAKLEFQASDMAFNGQPMSVKELKLRGKTTLRFRRKSFSVELEDRFAFPDSSNAGKSLKRFSLLSMSMDRGYYGNRLAFDCLRELGLFGLYQRYMEVRINGQSEGLYLLSQRPEDYALKDLDSPFILRRSAYDFIQEYKPAKGLTDADIKRYEAAFKEIDHACKNMQGEKLYQKLSQRIDLDAYFTWLAFNYWFMNGDYTDELFFYASPVHDSIHFHVIPWDYDDIFSQGPHEGWETRNPILGDQLIFSSESLLDRTIARDPFLYKLYCDAFRRMLTTISNEKLAGYMEQIYRELHPYLKKNAIIQMSQSDQSGQTDLNNINQYLFITYRLLSGRRAEILGKLKK